MITRSPKTGEYTRIDNATLRDGSLSWGASGLLAYLLSMPDNWKVVQSQLVSARKGCGRDALRKMLCELEEAGYLRKTAERDKGKFDGVDYEVLERPDPHFQAKKPTPEKPATATPATVEPATANPTLLTNIPKLAQSTNELEETKNTPPTQDKPASPFKVVTDYWHDAWKRRYPESKIGYDWKDEDFGVIKRLLKKCGDDAAHCKGILGMYLRNPDPFYLSAKHRLRFVQQKLSEHEAALVEFRKQKAGPRLCGSGG